MSAPSQNNEEAIVFEDSEKTENQSQKPPIETLPLHPKDILTLAKWVLIVCSAIFIAVGIGKIYIDTPGMKEVWEFSKIFVNSIVVLVLGFYFSSQKN
jgi:hypothetical protein